MIKKIINISIKEILDGRNYADAGKILFEKIQQILQDNNSVSIDMKDVESVPTSFMNTSFGDLMNVYGIDKVRESLYFKNITNSMIQRFRKYFDDYRIILNNRNQTDCLHKF